MSERALELLVPIIGDRIKVVAALKKLETCNSNADCVPTTTCAPTIDARCEVEVVQQVPETPVVSAARKQTHSPGPVVLNAKLPWPSKVELPTNFRPELANALKKADASNFTRKLRSQFIYLIYEHFSRYTM